MITLPTIEWFFGEIKFHGNGNNYSGSFGTDPGSGIFGSDILRFKVWIERVEDNYILICKLYKSFNELDFNNQILEENSFPATEESIKDIESYIYNYYLRYYQTGDEVNA